MFKLLVSTVYVLFVTEYAFAAAVNSADKPATTAKNTLESSSPKPNEEKQRTAAPLQEQESARTHGLYYPSHGFAPIPLQVFQPYSPHYIQPSYYSYQRPSIPSITYVQNAPLASHISSGAQVSTVSTAGAVKPLQPVSIPAEYHGTAISSVLPIVTTPSVSHATIANPVISPTTISKPVMSINEHVVQRPVLTINERVIHKPVITEQVQIIRRPIVTEVQEVVHRPVFTEVLQVIKNPTYTQHVVKRPVYSSVASEIHQAPLHVSGEQYHIVTKPQGQVVHLPTQYVQPITTEVVQVPVVQHETQTVNTVHTPAVSTISHIPISQGYGSSISSGYGYGSGYGIGSPVVQHETQTVNTVHTPAVSTISHIPISQGYGSSISSGYGYGSGYGIGSQGYGISSGNGIGSAYGGNSGISSGYGYGSGYYSQPTTINHLTPISSCRGKECDNKKDTSPMMTNMQPMPNYGFSMESIPVQGAQLQWGNFYIPFERKDMSSEQTPSNFWYVQQMQEPQTDETSKSFEQQKNEEIARQLMKEPRFMNLLDEIKEKVEAEATEPKSSNSEFEELVSRISKLSQSEKAKMMAKIQNNDSSSNTESKIEDKTEKTVSK